MSLGDVPVDCDHGDTVTMATKTSTRTANTKRSQGMTNTAETTGTARTTGTVGVTTKTCARRPPWGTAAVVACFCRLLLVLLPMLCYCAVVVSGAFDPREFQKMADILLSQRYLNDAPTCRLLRHSRPLIMGEAGEEVMLYVYDLSGGLAQTLGQSLLKKNIEGVWHTAVVVFGKEHFFGSNGISVCDPGTTALGKPLRTHSLGRTCLPQDVFQEYLRGLEQDTFSADKYNLLRHNCNNFSNEISQFLCGNPIPSYILDLPNEILSTPVGQQLAPFFELIANNIGVDPGVTRSPSDFESLNNDIDSARN